MKDIYLFNNSQEPVQHMTREKIGYTLYSWWITLCILL